MKSPDTLLISVVQFVKDLEKLVVRDINVLLRDFSIYLRKEYVPPDETY